MTTPPKMTGSRSEEVIRKHKEFLWPAVTNYYREPLVADHASMQYLWDVEGNKYLDFFGGILTIGVGHAIPRSLRRSRRRSTSCSTPRRCFPTKRSSRWPKSWRRSRPGKLQKSFFTSSGHRSQRSGDPAGAHGRPELRRRGAAARLRRIVGAGKRRDRRKRPGAKAGVISVGVSHAVNPYCYRCPLHLKYPECGVACANDVENLIQTGTSGSIAAFIAEPIQGVGGFITPPPEYFKIVYRIVKNYGGLFISDEVQTGFGRTGKKWFGIEQWEVTPDIITCAKSMANGVPVGATITTAELADKFQGLTISTFGGNPVTSVAARAVIEVIEEENLRENTYVVGGYLREKLEELKEKYPLIGDVRGMGMMQGLELVRDRETKEPAPVETTELMERARANGLLIGKGGLYGNVIRLAPPMNISKADVDEGMRLLDKSFGEIVGR